MKKLLLLCIVIPSLTVCMELDKQIKALKEKITLSSEEHEKLKEVLKYTQECIKKAESNPSKSDEFHLAASKTQEEITTEYPALKPILIDIALLIEKAAHSEPVSLSDDVFERRADISCQLVDAFLQTN